MKTFPIVIAIVAVATFYFLWPAGAGADDWNKETSFTFNEPVEIPGMVLPAGTYVFKRAVTVDPHVIQILNADQTRLYATVMTVPDYRTDSSDKTLITFKD